MTQFCIVLNLALICWSVALLSMMRHRKRGKIMAIKLSVESDGDRYPKDVYLVDQDGQRVATMEGVSEDGKFKLARLIARCVNDRGADSRADTE